MTLEQGIRPSAILEELSIAEDITVDQAAGKIRYGSKPMFSHHGRSVAKTVAKERGVCYRELASVEQSTMSISSNRTYRTGYDTPVG